MPGEAAPAEHLQVVTVGADPANDVRLEGVFPFHVRIVCDAAGCTIEDLTREQAGSTQTFLVPAANPSMRLPVSGSCRAAYADWLYLGTRRLPLSSLSPPPLAADATAPDAEAPPAGGITIRVGADPANRFVAASASVSDFHAEIRLVDGACWVRDCASRNGTWWLDPRDPALLQPVPESGWTRVALDHTLVLGSYRLPLARLAEIQDIPLCEAGHVNIGRAAGNHRVLDRVTVSSWHARISFREGQALAEDRGSIGGTFLNGRKLAPFTPHLLRQGDKLRIASYELCLDSAVPNQIRVDYADSVTLDVESLGAQVAGRDVLHDVSFSAQPGELVGILGPSGHGKSLLLEALLHTSALRVTGSVRFNGTEVRETLESVRQQTGFVPQGEVLPAHLTAGQILEYGARLWIRSDLTAAEVDRQIDAVLSRLNVGSIRDKPVRVLSGGELRRLSIAHELIRAPRLLLLDEPTSGLSTREARGVMRTLRGLADEGHTVICVIHQPSRDVYALFHAVAILFRGRVIYYGPPQFSNPFFGCEGSHPEDVFTVLEGYERELEDPARAGAVLDRLTKRFRDSREYREYVAERLSRTGGAARHKRASQ
jgi:ABC-type multidrug transport system ATPase subunit